VGRARLRINSSVWSLGLKPISIFEIIVSGGDALPVFPYLAGRRLASHRSPHNVLVNKFRDFDCHFLQPSGREGKSSITDCWTAIFKVSFRHLAAAPLASVESESKTRPKSRNVALTI